MKHSGKILIFSLLAVFLLLVVPRVAWAGYGEAGTGAGVAPVCTASKPAAPWLYYAEAVGNNKVNLVWDQNALATSWTVAYGVSSGTYIYGVDRFGDSSSRSIIISDLPAGSYYFVVRANNGCMPGPFSNEQNVRVGRRAAAPVAYRRPVEPTLAPGVPTATPTPVPKYRAPTVPPKERVPTVEHRAPVSPWPTAPPLPTPTPQPGFFQRIINFFLGLFR